MCSSDWTQLSTMLQAWCEFTCSVCERGMFTTGLISVCTNCTCAEQCVCVCAADRLTAVMHLIWQPEYTDYLKGELVLHLPAIPWRWRTPEIKSLCCRSFDPNTNVHQTYIFRDQEIFFFFYLASCSSCWVIYSWKHLCFKKNISN